MVSSVPRKNRQPRLQFLVGWTGVPQMKRTRGHAEAPTVQRLVLQLFTCG